MHRMTTMTLGACVGYTSTLATHQLTTINRNYNMLNRNNGESFFDGKNYRSIIKCLDDGYQISIDLIEYMEDYCNLLQDIIHRLTTYSNKWKSKLKHQSTLSSYHTTKRAQLQTVKSPEKLVQLIQSRSDAIQKVIATYKREVDRMYPSERFGTLHKHYRSHEMERLFKNAYSYVLNVSDKLKRLRIKEKEAENAVRDAEIQCQNVSLNEMTSKNKLSRANNHHEEKQSELQAIKDKIVQREEEYNRERETYREKATDIYEQCRELEKERLDQIRETLIKFIEAIHSLEYSNEQNTIYKDLLSNIQSQQDTLRDLDFWAQAYHVNIVTKSISSETNENENENENTEAQITIGNPENSQENETNVLPTIEENTNQSIAETEVNQSVTETEANQSVTETEANKPVIDKTANPAKSKIPKKKKNSTAEATTHNVTGLGQV